MSPGSPGVLILWGLYHPYVTTVPDKWVNIVLTAPFQEKDS